MSITSPNMGLVISTINVDTGLAWETNLNASLSTIDQHNHTPGYGVQIPSAGLNINSNLSFQGNQAIGLNAAVFTPQTSVATLDAIYVKGVDLYYNDGSSNVIQITAGGLVNATSSGISSGTASASFVSSVLVVNAASTTPADIKVGSVFIGNNTAGSKYLKLSPPNAMGSNYTLVLPNIPGSTLPVTLDSSGNFGSALLTGGQLSASASIVGSQLSGSANILGSQLSASAGIVGTQLANHTIAALQITANTITGTEIYTSADIACHTVNAATQLQTNGQNAICSQVNVAGGTQGMSIIRGQFDNTGSASAGEGWSISYGTTVTTITFTNAFPAFPVIVFTPAYNGTAYISAFNNTAFTITGTAGLCGGFIVAGQRF